MTSSALNPSVSPSHLGELERPDLKPPRQERWGGPIGLALVVHALLIVALTWGVGWKRDATPAVFEAELWSALPKAAAPRAVAPPPPPAAASQPVPKPAPSPPPKSAPKPESAPAPKSAPLPAPTPVPSPTQADIATEQAKKQAQQAKRVEQIRQETARKDEAEKAAVQKARLDKAAADKAAVEKKRQTEKRQAEKAAADKAVADKAAADKVAADKVALEKKRQAEKRQAEKVAADKKAAELKAEKAQAAQERLEVAAAAKAREDQMRRIMGQAGATGGPQATGSAQRASGPSAGYNARLVARIKPNVVFTDAISGNPVAEIEVRTQPDGTITSRRLVKSSGNPAWDEAALRAIDRTGSLPRDTDGSVPSPMIVVLRPQD